MIVESAVPGGAAEGAAAFRAVGVDVLRLIEIGAEPLGGPDIHGEAVRRLAEGADVFGELPSNHLRPDAHNEAHLDSIQGNEFVPAEHEAVVADGALHLDRVCGPAGMFAPGTEPEDGENHEGRAAQGEEKRPSQYPELHFTHGGASLLTSQEGSCRMDMLVKRAPLAYTLGMMIALILASLIPAQSDGLWAGEVPETAATYRVNFPNDPADYYAGILVDDAWVKPGTTLPTGVKRVEIVFDTPWEPREHLFLLINKVTLDYETPALRKKRLHEGWDSAGYVFVEVTENGKQVRRPVLKQELDLAQRARAMASAVETQWTPKDGAPPPAAPAEAVAGETRPGFLSLWGGHLLLGGAGLLVLAAVLKLMILRD